eukprot:3906105-Prymnesium_polylepis.1
MARGRVTCRVSASAAPLQKDAAAGARACGDARGGEGGGSVSLAGPAHGSGRNGAGAQSYKAASMGPSSCLPCPQP